MSDNKNTIIEITTGTIFRGILLVLFLVFLYLVRDVLAIVLFSVIIASAIEPICHWGGENRIPRILIVISIYAAGFAFLGILFYLVFPPLISEFLDFVSAFPSERLVKTGIQTIFGLAPNFPQALSEILTNLVVGLQASVEKFTSGFFRATASIFGGAVSMGLIVVISFYLSAQEHGIEKFLQVVTPKSHEKYIIDLWLRSQQKIGRWLQGQVLLGVLVGVLVYLGLTVLGIKYALMLALIAMVLELIPIFGPILASIPAIAIAFLQSPLLALEVIALYIIIQQFENHLIYPIVVRKITGVPSILIIIAMIIGVKLGGVWGILLAVPITAVLNEFLNDIAVKKQSIV